MAEFIAERWESCPVAEPFPARPALAQNDWLGVAHRQRRSATSDAQASHSRNRCQSAVTVRYRLQDVGQCTKTPPKPPAHHRVRRRSRSPARVLAGYCPLGNYPSRGQPDQQFAGHAVAGPELGGALLAHVAAADPGSRRADVLEAVAELRGALDDDKGVRRGGVVD